MNQANCLGKETWKTSLKGNDEENQDMSEEEHEEAEEGEDSMEEGEEETEFEEDLDASEEDITVLNIFICVCTPPLTREAAHIFTAYQKNLPFSVKTLQFSVTAFDNYPIKIRLD